MPKKAQFWAGDVIILYFFENYINQAITVKGVRYRVMINNFFLPELYDMDTNDMYFQRDYATCLTGYATLSHNIVPALMLNSASVFHMF